MSNASNMETRARRRILVVVGSLARGGAERQALLCAEALRRLDHEVVLFAATHHADVLSDLPTRQVQVDLGARDESVLAQVRRLSTRLSDMRPDVVLTFMWSATWRYELARRASTHKRPAWIIAERGNTHLSQIVRHPVRQLFHHACLRAADLVVVNSSCLASNLLAIAPTLGTKVSIVPNVILSMSLDVDAAHRRLQALVGDTPSGVVYGAIGSFQEDRNHDLLAEAFALVISVDPNARLVVIGRTTGEECRAAHARFCRAIARLGIADRVTIAGDQPAARELLPAFDVFVLASKLEGSSNALAEAIVAGAAVAATPVADTEQLLDGAGVVSSGFTPAALAEAMTAAARRRDELRAGASARRDQLLVERSPAAVGEIWDGVVGDAIGARGLAP